MGRVYNFSNMYPDVDIRILKTKFRYEEETGKIYRYHGAGGWKVVKRSDFPDKDTLVTCFNRTNIQGHHLAWLLMYGHWPKEPIEAIDGNLKNLSRDNLVYASSLNTKRLGNYLVRKEGKYWGVKIWHYPHLYKGTRKKHKKDAVNWAETQLNHYNLHAYITKASAQNNSEERETNHKGVYEFKLKNLYVVRVYVNGKYEHYSYEKNIEDAVESQIRGQAEIDEIWGNPALLESFKNG